MSKAFSIASVTESSIILSTFKEIFKFFFLNKGSKILISNPHQLEEEWIFFSVSNRSYEGC